MEQNEIERIVRRGGHHLAEALHVYWPTNGNNEVGERNITLHLARSFADAGFMLYAEGHSAGSTDTRVDVIALHVDRGVQVVVEAKRLYNSGQAARMIEDVGRIASFELSRSHPLRGVQPAKKFGVVVATTWIDAYAKWFSRNDAAHPDGDVDIWEAFSNNHHLRSAAWGSLVLRGWDTHFERTRVDEQRFHYLVYAIFRLQ